MGVVILNFFTEALRNASLGRLYGDSLPSAGGLRGWRTTVRQHRHWSVTVHVEEGDNYTPERGFFTGRGVEKRFTSLRCRGVVFQGDSTLEKNGGRRRGDCLEKKRNRLYQRVPSTREGEVQAGGGAANLGGTLYLEEDPS